jgi:aminopeptidase N
MGAMENKGLNVFNTAYVLADPTSATDSEYQRVEGVIGNEYVHNWTGNRVTCRGFQLTLKEVSSGINEFIFVIWVLYIIIVSPYNYILICCLSGAHCFPVSTSMMMTSLAVMSNLTLTFLPSSDQEFSGDMGSNAVQRIEDVRGLRAGQFREDNPLMAHPIRPDSYISMDNFYTATVYSKGAEVIRMYNTLLGKAGFRKGMDLYFERHDGSAVTCDELRAAMADANGVDLDQFALLYSTPGTPTVTYSSSYDTVIGTFSLTLTQTSQSDKTLHIPVSVGLLDKETG